MIVYSIEGTFVLSTRLKASLVGQVHMNRACLATEIKLTSLVRVSMYHE